MASALYIGALVASAVAGFGAIDTKPKRFPFITALLCISLTLCLALQYMYPALLPLLERNGTVLEGQWWRMGTALFFQDGWLAGGLSNIFFLVLIGSIAEQLYDKGSWLLIYFGTGVFAGCVALAWQPVGAGNSIAVFGLAAGIGMYTYTNKTPIVSKVFAGLGAACAIALACTYNIHGAAFIIGAVMSGGILLLQ